MKKIFVYAAMVLGFLPFTSCDENIPDEQFQKMVLLTKNGIQEYNVDFTVEGAVTVNLPVSINGTSTNNKDVTVKIVVDPDTLDAYNFERFRNRTALYYQLPSEQMYTFPSGQELNIGKGNDYSILPLTLNLNNFDLYSNYILPLKIENTSVYQLAWSQYTKLLMKLNVSNFFSGSFSVDGSVWEASNDKQKLPISSTTLRALTVDQCYLYAGSVTETDEDRAGYSLAVQVDKNQYEDSENPETGAEVRKYSTITIGSKNADKEVKDESNGNNWIEVSTTVDPINKNLKNVITKIRLKYSYMNLRDAEYPVKMIFEGTLTRSQSIDIRTGKPVTN